MDELEQDRQLLTDLLRYADCSAAAAANKAKIAPSTLQRPLAGKATTKLGRTTLDKLRDAYPDFPGWKSEFAEQRMPYKAELPPSGSDDTLTIPMLELAYGMGGTFLDDSDGTETLETFPRAFVRMFTAAPAEQLCFSHGIGDSMYPTIGDRDVLLIDRSFETVRLNDQIWVLSANGIGMVKRVRVEGSGQVVLLSDNEHVPPYPAAEDELTIIGRVVGVMKRL